MIAIFESNPEMKEEWERAFKENRIKKFAVIAPEKGNSFQIIGSFKFVIIDVSDQSMEDLIEKVKLTGADICLVSESYSAIIKFANDPRISSLCLKENVEQVVDWIRFMQHKRKMLDTFADKWIANSDRINSIFKEA
jgi:hypothetical protein